MKEYFEDDRPRDYTEYMSMSKEELDAEIARLEAEAKVKHNRFVSERELTAV